jgi:hypothetical protein
VYIYIYIYIYIYLRTIIDTETRFICKAEIIELSWESGDRFLKSEPANLVFYFPLDSM